MFIRNQIYNRLHWIHERKGCQEKMNNLPKHMARGPQRRGAPRGAGPNAAASA